jgi:hypothetical protein
MNASLAVDGIEDANWCNGRCATTGRDAFAWWAVDLGLMYHVYGIELINSQDESNGEFVA